MNKDITEHDPLLVKQASKLKHTFLSIFTFKYKKIVLKDLLEID